MIKGRIIVVSGPSGVGKGTVIQGVLKQISTLKLAVSVTTRLPREGEVDGVNYYFFSEEMFQKKGQENAFLEWCLVHGNYYGTLRSEVEQYTYNGFHVLLEIDVQGARKIRDSASNVYSVFIMPPSMDELVRRLQGRNTESESIIHKRVSVAQEELSLSDDYDSVITNDLKSVAIDELASLIKTL